MAYIPIDVSNLSVMLKSPEVFFRAFLLAHFHKQSEETEKPKEPSEGAANCWLPGSK